MHSIVRLCAGALFCFLVNNATSRAIDPILDYGSAKYFSANSPKNHLYIDIKGRMSIKKHDEELEYLLLAPHPREFTWHLDKKVYSDMIQMVNGASTITFIMEKGGNSIISRRFESEFDSSKLHQCGESPYGKNAALYPPKELDSNSLVEMYTVEDIYLAAIKQERIYGVLDYELNGYGIKIDFPIDLVNLNPNKTSLQSQWQAVSPIIPIYVGGDVKCQGIREGVVAMRDFFGVFEFVYLCGESGDKSKNDFHCTLDFAGKLRMFRK